MSRPIPASNSEDGRPNVFRALFEFNPCHRPAGEGGGRFATKGECPGGKNVPRSEADHGPFYGGAPLAKRGKWFDRLGTPAKRAYERMERGDATIRDALDAAEQEILSDKEALPEERMHSRALASAETAQLRYASRPDTQSRHSEMVDGKRVYTPERSKLHETILDHPDITNHDAQSVPEGQKPGMVIVMGLTAAGKSHAVREDLGEFNKNAVRIDSDEIKKHLKEYRGVNAAEVHEESSDLSKIQLDRALNARQNISFDFTGRSEKSVLAKLELARAHGYHVTLAFVDVTQENSQANTVIRFANMQSDRRSGKKKTGYPRFVPGHVSRTARRMVDGKETTDAAQVFHALKSRFDGYVHVDNNPVMAELRAAHREGRPPKKGVRGTKLEMHGKLY